MKKTIKSKSKKKIDLRKCKPGQKLRSIHGTILIYVRPLPAGNFYDHEIQYPNGSRGTRIHDGHTYRNPSKRLPEDEDIAEILPLEKSDVVPVARDPWNDVIKKW